MKFLVVRKIPKLNSSFSSENELFKKSKILQSTVRMSSHYCVGQFIKGDSGKIRSDVERRECLMYRC